MNSFIIESGVMVGLYFHKMNDIQWASFPVWENDIKLAKQFYSYGEAEQFVERYGMTRVNIKRSRLTIKCRPGVIQ